MLGVKLKPWQEWFAIILFAFVIAAFFLKDVQDRQILLFEGYIAEATILENVKPKGSVLPFPESRKSQRHRVLIASEIQSLNLQDAYSPQNVNLLYHPNSGQAVVLDKNNDYSLLDLLGGAGGVAMLFMGGLFTFGIPLMVFSKIRAMMR